MSPTDRNGLAYPQLSPPLAYDGRYISSEPLETEGKRVVLS
jgi:hypothetical protein